MFDVINKITVDAIISPKNKGERERAFHFLKLQPQDLILLDRGYPAFWLFQLALSMGTNFCARIPYKRWRAPMRHWTDSKIRCHLFTYVVAMNYLRRIELRLAAAGLKRTAADVM